MNFKCIENTYKVFLNSKKRISISRDYIIFFRFSCYPSDSEEFEEIFEKEGETFQDVFYNPIEGICDEQEMFSECFELYYTDSIHLDQKCPSLYNYIDLTINNYIFRFDHLNQWIKKFIKTDS